MEKTKEEQEAEEVKSQPCRLLGKFNPEIDGVPVAYTAGSDYNSATSDIMAKNSFPSSLLPRDRGGMHMPQMVGFSLQNLNLKGSSSEPVNSLSFI